MTCFVLVVTFSTHAVVQKIMIKPAGHVKLPVPVINCADWVVYANKVTLAWQHFVHLCQCPCICIHVHADLSMQEHVYLHPMLQSSSSLYPASLHMQVHEHYCASMRQAASPSLYRDKPSV